MQKRKPRLREVRNSPKAFSECGCSRSVGSDWGRRQSEAGGASGGEPTFMTAAAGCLPLLVTGVPGEAWSQAAAWWLILAGAWPVPRGAGAQAPFCRAGVFLLTRLKL